MKFSLIVVFSLIITAINAQTNFYLGADLSYVNELEDCGVTYQENNTAKDAYQIFADNGCNVVRLRLWHTPTWYDNLNGGNRYSDLADVKKSIQRAHSKGMEVLLDFHLSDTWADPSHQVIPNAWLSVVDDLPKLKDSLYNYIYNTLNELHQENLLPEMVQIGNETNKGILLSPTVNSSGWVLDWTRNSELFKKAIEAVRDIETLTNQNIDVCVHIANPADVDWFISNFISNGVTDFEIIGVSYYAEWHGTTTIPQVGTTIENLIDDYSKEVIIVEAGYPWTTNWNDNANNILTTATSNYSPISENNQKQWLIDLTSEVADHGGKGVIYWEPAWVSSSCATQWALGSHYENATFFNFNNNLIDNGGIEFFTHHYNLTSNIQSQSVQKLDFITTIIDNQLIVKMDEAKWKPTWQIHISDTLGRTIFNKEMSSSNMTIPFQNFVNGVYSISILEKQQLIGSKLILR